MAKKKYSPHADWLRLLETNIPILSVSVLDEAFSTGLKVVSSNIRRALRLKYTLWQNARDAQRSHQKAANGANGTVTQDNWLSFVKNELLNWSGSLQPWTDADGPVKFAGASGQYFLVHKKQEGAKGLLYVEFPDSVDYLEKGSVLKSPAEAVAEYCRTSKGAPKVALLTNGDKWTLVFTPEENPDAFATWLDGDVVFILAGDTVKSTARLARVRRDLHESTFLFDRRSDASAGMTVDLKDLDLFKPRYSGKGGTDEDAPYSRFRVVEDGTELFEKLLPQGFDDNNPFPAKSMLAVQDYMRDMLVWAFKDDVQGPADGPHEQVVNVAIRDRYTVGRLPPMGTFVAPEDEEELKRGAAEDDSGADSTADQSDPKRPAKATMMPNSVGMTFIVKEGVDEVLFEVGWGRYELEKVDGEGLADSSGKKSKTEKTWWRTPHASSVVVNVQKVGDYEFEPDANDQLIKLSVYVRLYEGRKFVTVFLANTEEWPADKTAPDDKWIFQPRLRALGVEGEAIIERKLNRDFFGNDEEMQSLELLYRDKIEFAIGHGASVHSTPSTKDRDLALSAEICLIPKYEVPATEPPGGDPDDRPVLRDLAKSGELDMLRLAQLATPEGRPKLVKTLSRIADDYADWIQGLEGSLPPGEKYEQTAKDNIAKCREVLERIREGIRTLETDDNALKAFGFANGAMAEQRHHSIFQKIHVGNSQADMETEIARLRSESKHHTWRFFQIAFFLLQIPSLADPSHRDRTNLPWAEGDLLWFPTGGGKTEAYLGAAAFAMAIRRLQPSYGPENLEAGRGLVVIMRYTLRLLTLQQFQRASTLICAMEMLRRQNEAVWGEEPFTIGLWVGSKVTDNTSKAAFKSVEAAKSGIRSSVPPFQITHCPWCGKPLKMDQHVEVDVARFITRIHCSLPDCDFSESEAPDGLPVKVIDEEMYHRPPTMLIATVDKFAQMATKGAVRTFFGRARNECSAHGLVTPDGGCPKKSKTGHKIKAINGIRPPDLIIQDEFHLISGPLGTMVGLYESAVDELCSWKLMKADGSEVVVHPKVIASSATVRKADAQMKYVFNRQMTVFPPNGINVGDNYFAVQRPADKVPGRLYIGFCSPGSARPPMLIRLYVALLTSGMDLYNRFGGKLADPFMTLVGYFNSLRELGGMRRLVEDDVVTRSYGIKSTGQGSQQTTSRPGLANRRIRLVRELTSRVSSMDIPNYLEELGHPYDPTKSSSPDVVLATNMLSVGVDVDRLGVMAVNGQPKNTAEYIQATSRVGRHWPGLVCTAFAWSRPRDLSHYERFEHYHATFYKHVEAQSVTPYSSRALERGLAGALVSYVRMMYDALAAEADASKIGSVNVMASDLQRVFSTRAWQATDNKDVKVVVDECVADVRQEWDLIVKGNTGGTAYVRKKGSVKKLLNTSPRDEDKTLKVPNSMREVEESVCLMLNPVDEVKDPWQDCTISPFAKKKKGSTI